MLLKSVVREIVTECSNGRKIGSILADMGVLSKAQLNDAIKQKESQADDTHLGEYLIRNGLVKEADIDKALQFQLNTGVAALLNETTDEAILTKCQDYGFSKESVISRFTRITGVVYVDLTKYVIEEQMIESRFNIDVMRANSLIPYEIDERNKVWRFASSDIQDTKSLKANTRSEGAKKGIRCEFNFAFDFEIQDKFENLSKSEESATASNTEQSAKEFVDTIITEGINKGASDIHIEPRRNGLRVRYRIDGIISYNNTYNMESPYVRSIISRIKVMSIMDVTMSRKPQDGIIKDFMALNKKYDLRVSAIQVVHGEKIVIRIAPKDDAIKDFDELGFMPGDITKLNNIIHKTNGIFFIAGATGSGKTTTLYSIINKINNNDKNICTIEDPIEREIDGINQVQVTSQDGTTGMKFADYLKAFLRQDPDIVIVGETRDRETADTSMRASLTGHFVVTTIHANNAIETISRMYDMDIDTFILSSTLEGLMSQRLVRKVCKKCAKERDITAEEKLYIDYLNTKSGKNYKIDKVSEGVGCSECNNTGYKGRVVIAEAIEMDHTIKEMIRRKVSTDDIEKHMLDTGVMLMEANGLLRVMDGTTTIRELKRIL